ncbi:outer membrane beta-barrel protein [Chitinophaga sp. GCM10012297]|uniref:Outer membrane beta-barrel protein n=1 Tax=Chitinophaga chungangae TaxID=2821488 RepID=A0ABS3YAD3_9BACT|nr:outer membrane beta-barrel protein [Chitinophaga chungangae]MBO9151634.1 outer membrane beta-barrel protein [Chitinophaga chungangae]
MVQYRFTGKFFVEAGPQVAALVNPKKRDYPDLNGPGFTSRHENIGDFLLAAGAGYQFNQNVGVYARYNQGLVSIRSSSSMPDRYNQVAQAGVMLKF